MYGRKVVRTKVCWEQKWLVGLVSYATRSPSLWVCANLVQKRRRRALSCITHATLLVNLSLTLSLQSQIFSQSLNPIYSNSSYPRRHGLSNAVPPLNTTVGGGSAKSAFTGGLGSPRTERFGGTGAVTSAGSGLTRRRKDETGGVLEQKCLLTDSC